MMLSIQATSLLSLALMVASAAASTYPVTDASQSTCYTYDGTSAEEVACDGTGQDGDYNTLAQSYCDHEDDTVTDMNTGLMWTKDSWNMTYDDANVPFSFAAYDDWRLPTMKELYTLIQFDGVTGSSEYDNIPYVNTEFFNVNYGMFLYNVFAWFDEIVC